MTPDIERQSFDRLLLDSVSESDVSRPSSISGSLTIEDDDEPGFAPKHRLSTFERVISTHAPIFESFLLQAPTDTIFQLYHTSRYLRNFLRSYPTAWQYLSFRLAHPSGNQPRPPNPGTAQTTQRQSRPYALDQLLLQVVIPFSPSLRSLDLDNTAVSGQNLTSTVLNMRRDTLEHLSVRGCKNVSLKYHIIPYLTMFGLQYDADLATKSGSSSVAKRLALKSLYTYRCRHHRRRPYLTSSLQRRDSDSEPTHELVKLCHKLGIWTDTAWCTTPASRCFRRRGYASMRAPQGNAEVWVVFDRLWRSKNWIGPPGNNVETTKRDGRLWEHDETGSSGEALGTIDGNQPGEGKTVPAHLRRSHRVFVEDIKCDSCGEDIHERCEQCSVLMHCVGCRKTLCSSCAYDIPYPRHKPTSDDATESFWWAPGATISPCLMQEPNQNPTPNANNNNNNNPNGVPPAAAYPTLKFHWCCTEPVFTGGGGISSVSDRIRAVPLPRKRGWEDPEFSSNEWSKTFPRYAYGDPKRPDYSLEAGHAEMMRWLLGPPDYEPCLCPRNLCQECFESPQWKVHCKSCSRPLCMEHDLRGLRLGICGYRELHLEKSALKSDSGNPNRNPDMGAASKSQAVINSHHSQDTDFQISVVPAAINQPGTSQLSSGTQTMVMRSSTDLNSPINSNMHTGSSSPSIYFEVPQEAPKWVGCQSFFCPSFRAIGDQRQRCSSVLRECTSCLVRVCQDCIQANPPCKCSYCENNYHCPNCHRDKVRDGSCRHKEEEQAKREELRKRELEKFAVALERNLANEVAGFAGQFFGSLELNARGAADNSNAGVQAGPSALQLPSTQYVPHSHANNNAPNISQIFSQVQGQPQLHGPVSLTSTPIPGPAAASSSTLAPAAAQFDEDEQIGSASEHTEPGEDG
ncbi:hypothetical protein VTO42DRAFT_5682 [Malbranchea cinnamomea]